MNSSLSPQFVDIVSKIEKIDNELKTVESHFSLNTKNPSNDKISLLTIKNQLSLLVTELAELEEAENVLKDSYVNLLNIKAEIEENSNK